MDYIDSKQDRIKLDKGLFFGKGLFETILVKEKAGRYGKRDSKITVT